ncbi:MAG: helix-turn-helix domain-containing protein [Actinobacteria bacterium]|nr:MAG: helix-turn-helix domain-containing protein [Actinomycetota bacterium]
MPSKTPRLGASHRQPSRVTERIRHVDQRRVRLSHRRESPVNDFERAELRALASLLEHWPTSDKTALGYSNDVVAILDSKSEGLPHLRVPAGDAVNEWLSVESAGRILGIGGHTVYGLINRGELVAYRIGRVYRIRADFEVA